ncbi:NADH:flavin oxidoreductase/NADH oxidase [Comamonas terrigena]|uniref:NADH:flavin oxidoreductase/NADH oxidase n=1 Tax=Comamonas terrigena TaxID=32013 RepID=UPI002354B478|nr:NADH:flavin oxidoreductase/NADH oxidase [Comamonas terrigena]
MSALFSPIAFGPLQLANRIVIPPMCMYSAQDGLANDFHVMHYGNLAQSGAGLLVLEATAVEARGRISAHDLGLWSDAHMAALRPVVQHLRRFSPMPVCIQLAHAGRKASCRRPWEGGGALPSDDAQAWPTVSASAIPFAPTDPQPQTASLQDIAEITQAFVDAALRARQLGLDAIEIHAAHGYLLHQFLSPLSNQRTDQYGGSLDNRMRLTLEVFEAVRTAVDASMAVGVRISATDWMEPAGWDLAQSQHLAQELAARGCDFLHVSSAALHPDQKIPVGPGYQVPLAEALKDRLEGRMPVIAVGLITDPQQAEHIVQTGQADAVGIARAMLYQPRWPWEAARQLGATVHAAPQYLRCQPHGAKKLFQA